MRLMWAETAKKDYKNLLTYIANENPQNALLVQKRIEKSLSLLPDFRVGTPIGSSNLVAYYIPKTSYFVVYKHTDSDAVLLLAFIHSSRDWMRHFAQDLEH
jgi:plasmid stabilization system protein ParE